MWTSKSPCCKKKRRDLFSFSLRTLTASPFPSAPGFLGVHLHGSSAPMHSGHHRAMSEEGSAPFCGGLVAEVGLLLVRADVRPVVPSFKGNSSLIYNSVMCGGRYQNYGEL